MATHAPNTIRRRLSAIGKMHRVSCECRPESVAPRHQEPLRAVLRTRGRPVQKPAAVSFGRGSAFGLSFEGRAVLMGIARLCLLLSPGVGRGAAARRRAVGGAGRGSHHPGDGNVAGIAAEGRRNPPRAHRCEGRVSDFDQGIPSRLAEFQQLDRYFVRGQQTQKALEHSARHRGPVCEEKTSRSA